MDAYRKSIHIYDDILTAKGFWSKAYNRLAWGMQDVEYVSSVLSFIPDDFRGKMLDIPVGTGVLTAEKYARLKSADITAVDASAEMLARAKKRFSEKGITNIAWMAGDAASLPFKAESFDLVLSMNGFHAFSDKERAWRETARVLKKGGLFCGCFYIRGERRATDFFVKRILTPGGWFTPPFYSKNELALKLGHFYSAVEIGSVKSIVYFKCIK